MAEGNALIQFVSMQICNVILPVIKIVSKNESLLNISSKLFDMMNFPCRMSLCTQMYLSKLNSIKLLSLISNDFV